MNELRTLIERVEGLTAPDKALDEVILKFLGFHSWAGRMSYRQAPMWIDFGSSEITGSIDAAVALVKRVLPGWGYRVATCSVSDDAWVFPDFNCPTHGERLRREFRQDVDWTEITDVDLRPSGREPIALILSMLFALEALHAG